jgi:hypothetical protein
MADPVNGLLAARMDPERRRRIGNALMAYQYDRETPQDAAVTERAGLFPLATYANGQTGPAWPGLIATPVEKMAQVLRGEITPGTPEFNEAGFDIAGAAMVGGLAAARPRVTPSTTVLPTSMSQPEINYATPRDVLKKAERQAFNRISAGSVNPITEQAWHGGRDNWFLTHGTADRSYEGPWGSSNRDVAGTYTSSATGYTANGAMMVPVEYRFRNPMEFDAKGRLWNELPVLTDKNRHIVYETDDLARAAQERGHDGLVVRNVDDLQDGRGGSLSTTYKPLQRGTVYSPLTGDLLYANARPGAALGAGLSGASERQGIRAYHGSPHDFDKFDTSKIGTGEGAQAYGHGLYFAENEAVAQSYKQPLLGMARGQSGADVVARQAMSTSATPEAAIEFIQQTIAHLRKRGPEGEKAIREFYEPAIDIVRSGGKPDGRMYEVNIKANPDEFLDWDMPLSQQSEKVRAALNSIPEAQALQRQPIYPDLGPWRGSDLPVEILTSRSGTWPRSGMSQYDPEISAVFRDAGIPGIKYLDQGSRSAGEGSRNYVVFDANLIEILKKYGLLGMLGAGGMAQELLKPSKPTIPDDAA